MSDLNTLFDLMRDYRKKFDDNFKLELYYDGSGEFIELEDNDAGNGNKRLFSFNSISEAVTKLNKLLNPPKEYVITCEYLLVNLYGPDIITRLLTLKEVQDLLNTPEYRSNSAYRYCLKKVVDV